jgi:predicted acylesterase/phospholipase RssA/CRP-like cAMP-binding protein
MRMEPITVSGLSTSDSSAALLESIEPFCRIDRSRLPQLEPELLQLQSGAILFRQGDPVDALFVILTGGCQLSHSAPDGTEQSLATFGPGEILGETAALHANPRATTARITEPSTVLRFSRLVLDRLAAVAPETKLFFQDLDLRRHSSLQLALTTLFHGLDHASVQGLAAEANWVRLRGGEVLFRQGDPSDSLYAVVHGRLQAVIQRADGATPLVKPIPRGTCVGEMGVLTDKPRSATVRAVRDSELIRLPKSDFSALLERSPQIATALARTLAERLQQTNQGDTATVEPATIAVVPGSPRVAMALFGERLAQALNTVAGSTLLLDPDRLDRHLGAGSASVRFQSSANHRIVNWLNEQEDRYRYIIYECDHTWSIWTERGIRQADLVLQVHFADDPPTRNEVVTRWLSRDYGAAVRTELVLLHDEHRSHPSGTQAWLKACGVEAHHHVRLPRTADYERLARMLTGRARSLVLSGGGARGFAHIGVIRAFREASIPVDLVGGTSMGSIIAAHHALGHDIPTMTAQIREGFLKQKLYLDTTIPLVALISAHKLVSMLKGMYGDTNIEDLWTRYFCVSANLTRAETMVHRDGPLWLAVRASISVPGVAPPVFHNGNLLVDGGVLNNLPADIARTIAPGKIIAVDVASKVDLTGPEATLPSLSGWQLLWSRLNPFGPKNAVPTIFHILTRSAMLTTISNAESVKTSADLYLQPPTQGISLFDWSAIDELVEAGYRYTIEQLEQWDHRSFVPKERRSS